MIVEIGGNATMNSGTIELSDKSQIVIELGGQMTINGGSTNFKDKSQVIIKKGGKMTIKSGVNIGLNDLAQIIVEVGGTLIIEKSANTGSDSKVQFTETNIKPDSNPNVLVQGELIVNAPIKMNGTAYFDFAQTNKVTLLSTFDFTGDSKAQKMINLRPNAVLNLQGKNVALITGMITYNNGTKIEMPQGKIADFVSTTFNGVGKLNMTALNNKYGVSPAILRISNCTFNGLNKCIDMSHNDISQSPSIFNISGSVFSEYSDFGILLTTAQQLYATNSSFFSNKTPTIQYSSLESIVMLCPPLSAPPAIIGDDIAGVVSLNACEITGVGARTFKERFVKEMQSNKSTTNAYNFLPLFGAAADAAAILESFNVSVYLNNVPHFFMKEGTNIHDAFNAIFARGNSNVIMSKGAALINNGIGLNMAPEESDFNALKPKGCLLFMDCSHLIDNALGILGRDVTLFTDEFVNSNYNNPNIFINFEQDEVKGRYFDIFYSINPITKQSSHVYNGYTIFSRNNIWSNNLPNPKEEYHIMDCMFANGSSCLEYTIDADPPANAKGDDCYTLSNDDDPFEPSPFKQGSINTQFGAVSALPFAWSGISAMLNQNLDEMRKAFTPLAKVSDYERNNTENGYTQMYVDIAKAFVYAPSDDVPIEVDGRNAKENATAQSNVLVYPNPAHQWLTVELPTQNHRLQLADGLGRSVYNETVNGTTRINVGQYPSGVYHIIVTAANGAQTRSKVVVQHD